MKRSRRGFTLVEILVGVGLILVIMGIAFAVAWACWRGFTGGVATAQSMQSANEALEVLARDLSMAPLRRTDEIQLAGGTYRFPVMQRAKTGRTVETVAWKLVPRKGGKGFGLERNGKPVLRAVTVNSLTVRAVTLAGPIAIEIEAVDAAGRTSTRLRKLVDMPLLRQRARYASAWEREPALTNAGGPS